MKKIYLILPCLILFALGCKKTETIDPVTSADFVDPKFFTYMQMKYDTNGDFVFQPEEILAVTDVDLSEETYIFNLKGIEKFVALERLDITNLNLQNKSLKVTNKKLKYLKCANMGLTGIDVSSLLDLEELRTALNKISSIDLRNNTKLRILGISVNPIVEIDLSNNVELREMYGLDNKFLYTIDFSNNKKIELVDCQDSNLKNIILDNCENLKTLNLLQCPLNTIDISDCVKLEDIVAEINGDQTSIDLRNNQSLKHILLFVPRIEPKFVVYMNKGQEIPRFSIQGSEIVYL